MSSNFHYPELAAIDRYRLEHDLTYRELGELVGVPWRSLYTMLTNRNARPFDRALYKIARFLEREDRAEAEEKESEEEVPF